MKLLPGVRARPVDGDQSEADPPEELPPIATALDQLRSTLAARALSAGLIGCLLLAPVAAGLSVYAVMTSTHAPVAPPAASESTTGEQAAVEEFAERVTVAWLTATRNQPEELLRLVPIARSQTLPERGFRVADPATANIQHISAGLWSVTVAATVTDDRRATVRRYYQLPVSFHAGTLTSLTLPGPVSPPSTGDPDKSEYRTELLSDGPVGVTAAGFLSAYLTSAGDVSRYVSPGNQLAAVRPAPFTTVRVAGLRTTANDDVAAPTDGQQIRVLVAATGTTTGEQTIAINYALTLAGRGGRWEIAAIDPAPVVPDPSSSTPDLPSDPAVTPTPSSTLR